ncbi:hypothetical protein ACEYYH_10490 [Microbacterium trichothecenolyticum]|uniref:hypothetical protein n=1 Tax=Microbacterium trichothecenolyticum TaxID=69370 RepID=UPI0035BE3230
MAIVFADIVGVGPNQIPGITEFKARRILQIARTFVPCLDSLTGEEKANAIAILQAAALELPEPGSRRVRSQSRNGTSRSLDAYESAFTLEDRAALRALCGSAPATPTPVGSFPEERPLSGVWPERYPT